MWFNKSNGREEYELVNQAQIDTDLEGQSSGLHSVPTPSPKSSSESSSSEIFENIDEYTQRKDDRDDFNINPKFQTVLYKYKAIGSMNKKVCALISGCVAALWVIALIVYSQGTALSIVSDLKWKTNITVSGTNVTLNHYDPTNQNLTLELYRKGTFFPFKEQVEWLNIKQKPAHKAQDGFYLSRGSKGSFDVKSVNRESSRTIIDNIQFSYKNNFLTIDELKLNPGKSIDEAANYHIVVSNTLSQWRHSSFALYWIYNTETMEYKPIQPPKKQESQKEESPLDHERLKKLHFAEFSPNGDFIVFGFNHNLYLQNVESMEVIEITKNGSPNIFNGKPDWVYEEEISADYKLFWWSPNQENLVYVSLDDSKVNEYDLDYYIKNSDEIGDTYNESEDKTIDNVKQYPTKKSIKYPKPGTPIPIVSLHNFKLTTKESTKLTIENSSLGDDFLFYDGLWIDDKNFLMKHTDRTSKILSKKLFQPEISNKVEEINSVNVSKEYDGWVEKVSPMTVFPTDNEENSYVDKIVVNKRTHLALFEKAASQDPSRILTDSNNWEIISDSPVVVDKTENIVYCLSTMRSSMESHLIAVKLATESSINIVTDVNKDGVYEISFDQDGQYLNLNYNGPNNPWQKLINMADIHNILESRESKDKEKSVNDLIEKTKPINHVEVIDGSLKMTNIPTRLYKTVRVDKFPDKSPVNLNVLEILPPNFDPNSHKYPLLVHAYGGPGSQTVDKRFGIDFEDVVSAKLDAIVLIIDPRGTTQDWKSRAFVSGKLGYWEPRDITTVVSEYIEVNEKFINRDRTAIWGWSYGGFTTLKTLEYDHGETFKFGMAVAPVTNWLFYDAVYTERYMGLPSENDNYDKTSRIKEFKNFDSVKRFLIMHGMSDDNVHLQNSLWLLDKFNLNNLENYDVHFFPDNDHSIYYHNSNLIVYDKLLHWLFDAFSGKFDNFV
ncbi:DEHA2G23144p [Debaryomyces hansenii CBS767]|uniref:DEHA2G23144p n=1 Tax=Debaryomyces hansenii (strain ATCC 36239 / CBS 767 / BCRC 21394 / JCM 1990 / NBRC 0083 / IGC 2968) TaxID=284592 RepID=Q6BGX3_DEBHA|nr:DEHA2G23144p [Debaryomyces hansenii CBS767]CAG91059.2 DEHA2G23144p [Debaryomyces hansenii CBS767]|eukprot:XP_462548.2 DEHA2G23144p [Debaryomyces hansenii CBS767]